MTPDHDRLAWNQLFGDNVPIPPIADLADAPDETTALTQHLDAYRTLLLRKAWGLNHQQLHTPCAPSTLTLGGLVHHLALVEDDWFDHNFAGRPEREPWASAPWHTDRDWPEFVGGVA